MTPAAPLPPTVRTIIGVYVICRLQRRPYVATRKNEFARLVSYDASSDEMKQQMLEEIQQQMKLTKLIPPGAVGSCVETKKSNKWWKKASNT